MDTESTESDSGSHNSAEMIPAAIAVQKWWVESESEDSSDHKHHPFMYEPVLASANTEYSATEGDSDTDGGVSLRLTLKGSRPSYNIRDPALHKKKSPALPPELT